MNFNTKVYLCKVWIIFFLKKVLHGGSTILLKVSNGSRVSVQQLWNYAGVSCNNGDIFRDDFIDRLNDTCFTTGSQIILKISGYTLLYNSPFPDSTLKGILNKQQITLGNTEKVDLSNEFDNGGFEYLALGNSTFSFLFGWYYNTTDINSPRFYIGRNVIYDENNLDVSNLQKTDLLTILLFYQEEGDCASYFQEVSIPEAEIICPGPTVQLPGSEVGFGKGENASIACNITSGLDITRTYWTFDGDNIIIDNVKYSGLKVESHDFVIHNFSKDDVGVYACHAEDGLNISSSEVTVVLYGPPEVTLPPEYVLHETEDIILDCEFHSKPEASNITWLKGNEKILTSGHRFMNGTLTSSALTIKSANSSDLGFYKCCVSNKWNGVSETCKRTMIQGDPFITVATTNVELAEGVELQCSFISYPSPVRTFWRKNGNELNNNQGLSGCNMVPYAGQNMAHDGNLNCQLQSADASMRGVYTCCVENSNGISCSENITVGAMPYVTISYTTVTTSLANDTLLSCQVDAIPQADLVFWAIENAEDMAIEFQTFNASTKYEFDSDGTSLRVLNPGFGDSGKYVCKAGNIYGLSNSTALSLEVYGVEVNLFDTTIHAVYSSSVTLGCRLLSKPNLTTVDWYATIGGTENKVNVSNPRFEGGTIDNANLTLKDITFDDNGLYCCSGTNTRGNAKECGINLVVTGDVPAVTMSENYILVNTSSKVVLPCIVNGEPDVQSVTWYKNSSGKVTMIPASPTAPNLTLTKVSLDDAGNYTCSATNAVGSANSTTILHLDVNSVIPMCPCSCEYKAKLEFWAAQNISNHTYEEWQEILAPVLAEIKRNLTVDKTKLSATIRKLTSAPDDRKSSESVGIVGIIVISAVLGSIFLIDIIAIRRYIANVRGSR